MKINKYHKQIKNDGWRYVFEGNILTDVSLEFDLDMMEKNGVFQQLKKR